MVRQRFLNIPQLVIFRTGAKTVVNRNVPRGLSSNQAPSSLSINKGDVSLNTSLALARQFRNWRTGADFHCGGTTRMPPPSLTINGVGHVSHKLHEIEVRKIISVTQKSCEEGSMTPSNTVVRNSFLIEKENFSFSNPDWDAGIKCLKDHVAVEFGIDPNYVEAKIEMLVLCKEGCLFKPRTEASKHKGKFGTLMVQLPSSNYRGGETIVQHRDIALETDFGSPHSKEDCFYNAYYDGCKYEAKVLKSGVKLTAIYSLWWKGSEPPVPESSQQMSNGLVKHLSAFNGCKGLMLTHHYSIASLARYGVDALRGEDRTTCKVLISASSALSTSGDRLVIHIVKITRSDCDGGRNFEFGVPEIKSFQDDVFCLDGSSPSAECARILKSFRLYDDVLNHAKAPSQTVANSFDAHTELNNKKANDKWWFDEQGCCPSYLDGTLNHKGEIWPIHKMYSSYAITFWRHSWARTATAHEKSS